MGTEYKTDNSLGDYITGLATGHAYNVWSAQGAQHHKPYTPPPLPHAPTKSSTAVPIPPVTVPLNVPPEDYSVVGHDYSGPYGIAAWVMDQLFRALFKVEKAITPYLWVIALAGALTGAMAAGYFGIAIFPSQLLNLAVGAVVGVFGAALALAALKILATITILAINVVMSLSIFGLMLAGIGALAAAAVYLMSFFVPELAGLFPEW